MLSLLLILAVLGVGAAAAAIAWASIDSWLESQRIRGGATATLLKKRLADGRYQVVGGVFSSSGARIATGEWSGELDAETTARFGASDEITIHL